MTAFQLLLQNLRDDAQDLRAMAAMDGAGGHPLRDLADNIAAQAEALERTMTGRIERPPVRPTLLPLRPAA